VGVWGSGLYSGDFALDRRCTFKALTRLPFDGEELLQLLCDQRTTANNPDDEDRTTLWLIAAASSRSTAFAANRGVHRNGGPGAGLRAAQIASLPLSTRHSTSTRLPSRSNGKTAVTPDSTKMLPHGPIGLPFLRWSFQDSPLDAAVNIADENLGGVHFPSDPLGVAHGVRPLTVPEAERSASRGLEKPIAAIARVRNDFKPQQLPQVPAPTLALRPRDMVNGWASNAGETQRPKQLA
jgi:hypothetical protein